MATTPPSPTTTRLERIGFGSAGADFGLDGRPVQLRSDAHAGPLATFRDFYAPALADYYVRAASLRPPSLLGRLRSWIGGLFGRRAEVYAPAPAPAAVATVPAPPQPQPQQQTPVQPARQPTAAAAPAPGSGSPVLHLVFADRDGVHLTWESARPGPDAAQARLVLTYPLDSALARRLQDCYGELSKLGYKVADLGVLRPEAAKRPAAPEPEEGPGPEKPAEPRARRPRATVSQLPLPVPAQAPEPQAPEPDAPEP
jgi:hypothetical protein